MERNAKLKSNSRSLRKNATKEENLLWYHFLRKYPVQFRRQYVLGDYIVDLFCHKARMVVELDGSQHCTPDGFARDRARSDYLNAQGLFVLRFSNMDVLFHFDRVCESIDRMVKERISGQQ